MSKKCLFQGCIKTPIFNHPTKKIGVYCFEHKKENMIDVKNKRCIEEGCSKRPTFNYQTEIIGLFCFEHKKENIHPTKKFEIYQLLSIKFNGYSFTLYNLNETNGYRLFFRKNNSNI